MTPSRPPAADGRKSDMATYLALFGLVVVAAGLLALAAMVNIAIFGVLLIVVGFVLIGVFHYVVWGWWMSRQPIDDEDER